MPLWRIIVEIILNYLDLLDYPDFMKLALIQTRARNFLHRMTICCCLRVYANALPARFCQRGNLIHFRLNEEIVVLSQLDESFCDFR